MEKATAVGPGQSSATPGNVGLSLPVLQSSCIAHSPSSHGGVEPGQHSMTAAARGSTKSCLAEHWG